MPRALVVDALARGSKLKRVVTVDVIGAGPRAVAALLESRGLRADLVPAEAVAEDPSILAGYDVLMVSAMTSDEGSAAAIAREWRRRSGGPAVLGGPVTADPTSVARPASMSLGLSLIHI